MALTSRTFRIFISSTFGDLQEERNSLQKNVFPRLRDLCRQHGCRFQAIDLRWGVREEAGLDQQTMKICLGEIERCRKISPRPNFVVLLGDRYGWRPLPPEIAADEFEAIEKNVPGADDRTFLRLWYQRDDNAVPAVYGLKPRRVECREGVTEEERSKARDDEAAAWRATEAGLFRILAAASAKTPLSDDRQLKYGASATEQEIAAGALKIEDAEKHVFCFFRKIEGLPGDKRAGVFADLNDDGSVDLGSRSRLNDLKGRLWERLPKNVFEYPVKWVGQAPATDHLDTLCDNVYQSLSGIILEEIRQLGDVDPVEKETADHEAFRRDRTRVFFGREQSLRSVSEYLDSSAPQALGIFGASGSGKSALMAMALELARKRRPDALVIGRFIGATPGSTDARTLLESLCREISRGLGADESGLPSDYKDLVEELPKRLALAKPEKPLFIFIDALDQLSDSHNAKSLTWMPAQLPENARLVVSTAPGDCWDMLEKKTPETHRRTLEPMTPEDGRQTLGLWLKNAGRTLQPPQREAVLGRFRDCGLPLYLKLAFEEAKLWKSSSPPGLLSADIPGMVRVLFSRLSSEANHGKVLTAKSLGYLRAAKNGLSEDEVIDVLSADEEVFADFTKRAFHRPPEQRLPVVVWSRLYFDLEPYLIERSADGASLLSFFHRQMGEVAEEDFLAGESKRTLHERLARYFAGQPLYAGQEDGRTANLRKLSELPFQQTGGALWNALYETLTDFEFLEAKCTHSGVISTAKDTGQKIYGGVYELIEDYRGALAVFPANEQEGS